MKQGTAKTYGAALAELDAFLGQLSKTASGEEKTTQEVQKADDGTVPVTEGAHAKELARDVKKIPLNINEAAPASDTAVNNAQKQTEAKTTGDTGQLSTKPVPDANTAKPGNSENEKGAAFIQGIKEACAKTGASSVVTELGNKLMADIAVMGETTEKQAAVAGEKDAETLVKEAAEKELNGVISHIEKEAAADAVLLRDFYAGYVEGLEKKSEGEEGASEPVPGDAGGEGAIPPEDIAQLQAAAGEGGMPAGAEGGMPPMGAEGAAGAEGGAPDDAQVLEALSQALEDAGITPEELVQALESEQGGMQGPTQGPAGTEKAGSVKKTIEEKKAAADMAKLAMCEINRYRNLKSVGRVQVKKASIDLAYQMRIAIRRLTGK